MSEITAAPASEQLADSPARHLLGAGRTVEHLIDATPATWPGLWQIGPDVTGHCVAHYAAARGTATAEAITAPDGVLAAWRSLLAHADEQQQDPQYPGATCVLRGERDSYRVTVVVSVMGGAS